MYDEIDDIYEEIEHLEDHAAPFGEDDVTPEQMADRYLWRLKGYTSELARVNDVAERRIQDVENWRAEREAKLQRGIDYWQARLYEVMKVIAFPKGRKSLDLPTGKIGTRTRRETLRIEDDEAFTKWCEEQQLGSAQVVFKRDTKGAKDRAMHLLHTSGELVPGLHHTPASEESFFKLHEE